MWVYVGGSGLHPSMRAGGRGETNQGDGRSLVAGRNSAQCHSYLIFHLGEFLEGGKERFPSVPLSPFTMRSEN